MKTIDNLFRRAARFFVGALVMTGFAACSEKGGSDDVVPPPVDVVEHPVAVVQYEGSKQAKTDVQTLLEIATKLTALRWALYINITDNFNAEKGFQGDPEKADWEAYQLLANDMYVNADAYLEALQRLTDNAVWDAKKISTRAFNPPLKDFFMCFYNAGEVLDSGHKKIYDVINSNGGKLNTPEEWKKLFNEMPEEYRFGETDYRQWRNRVYNKDYGSWNTRAFISSRLFELMCWEQDFYDTARDLAGNNDPKAMHMVNVGNGLTEQGINLELAIYKTFNPALSGFCDGIDLGKSGVSLVNAVSKGDANETRDAMLTISNVIATQVGGFDSKSKWWMGETVNIGYETMRQTVFKDLSEMTADENALMDGVGLINIKDLDNSGAQIYIIDNGNGKTKVALATNGEAKVPFTQNGTYTITGVDANGNTSTTTVGAQTGQTTNAEVDTKKKDDEEIPKDPRLTVSPPDLSLDGTEDEMTLTVTTNYRYYGVKADKDWITATPISGSNKVRVSVPMNPTGKEREGHVYVMATDKAGNILKTVSVPVYQERNDAGGVVPDTDVLRFAYNAYDKSIGVELIQFEYLGAYVDDEKDEEWLSVRAGATDRYVEVFVEENKTGKERRGTIMVFGSNTLNPAPGEYMPVPVTVIQEPEGKLSLTPPSLTFEVDGGSASLTAILEGYAKMGSFIDTDGQGWLEVKPDGPSKTVSVNCKRNDTGKDRIGHFYVFATNFDNPVVGDIKQVKVEVKQMAGNSSTPYVLPDALTYPAEGGTQNVKVNEVDYTRGGYSVSNDGKGWVSVSFSSFSRGMDITVAPNTTGQKRTCTVNCHLAKKDNPSADEILTLPISITQEANELEPGEIIMNDITSCELTAVAMMKNRKKGTSAFTEYKQSFSAATFTQDGSTVHVQAANNYKEGEYDVYQNIISFDIVNFSGNFATCKIENLSFRHVYSNNYVDWTQPGVYGKGDEVDMELTNLPWQRTSSYRDGGNSGFAFSGPVTSGVAFLKLTEKKVGYSEDEPTQYFDYVENNNNRAMLSMKFKATGTTTSRLQLSLPLTNTQTPEGIVWNQ